MAASVAHMRSRLPIAIAIAGIAAGMFATVALADWTAPPTTISAQATNPLIPVGNPSGLSIAMDPDGGATAVWAQAGAGEANDSAYSARMVDGNWSTPVAISSVGASIVRPHVAVGSSGNPLVTWLRGPYGSRSVEAVRYSAGRWVGEAVVSSAASNGSDAYVAVDGADSGMALWTLDMGAGTTVVRSARYSGGAWGTAADIPGSGTQSQASAIVAGAPGQVTALWSGGNGTAVSTATATSGTWGAVTSFPAAISSTPVVALNGSGAGAIAWAVAPGVAHVARRVGSGWGADEAVSPITDTVRGVRVAVDGAGVITVVWARDRGDGTQVLQAVRSTATGWTTPVDIAAAEPAATTLNTAVAAGENGQVAVVWSGTQDGRDVMRAVTRTSAGWGAPSVINSAAAGAQAETLTPNQVAVDSLGRATAAWLWHPASGGVRALASRLQGVPNAPTSPTAAAGNASVEVRWTAPADNGSSAITGYRVTATPGGATCTTTTTTCRVAGLTNGTAYTFTVAAANAIGTGPESSATAAARPEGTSAPRVIGSLKATVKVSRRTIVTTGSVATGVTKVSQRATAKGKKTRQGLCRILAAPRTGADRAYRCTMKMVPAKKWTITTEAKDAGGVLARNVRAVRVR